MVSLALAAVMLTAIAVGSYLLRRAFSRRRLLPEELALAGAWVFVAGGVVWLQAYVTHSTLLGFGEPWTWLAAAHFGAAGFGALTITALTCRVVTDAGALRVLRALLAVHPPAYLITSAGISGFRYCGEIGAASYELLFLVQLAAFSFGKPNRMPLGPRRLLFFGLSVPVATLLLALAWAWRQPLLDLDGMVRYHGLANAIGHVGVGLLAFAWGRPLSHAPLKSAPGQPEQR